MHFVCRGVKFIIQDTKISIQISNDCDRGGLLWNCYTFLLIFEKIQKKYMLNYKYHSVIYDNFQYVSSGSICIHKF